MTPRCRARDWARFKIGEVSREAISFAGGPRRGQNALERARSGKRRTTKRQRARPRRWPPELGLWIWLLGGCSCPTTSTVAGLMARSPIAEREVACVRAVYRGSFPCDPCPSDALCQPCMPVVLLAEAASSPDEQVVWVSGSAEGLVEGRAYTFRLELQPGFEEQLRTKDNNPIYFAGSPPVELLAVSE